MSTEDQPKSPNKSSTCENASNSDSDEWHEVTPEVSRDYYEPHYSFRGEDGLCYNGVPIHQPAFFMGRTPVFFAPLRRRQASPDEDEDECASNSESQSEDESKNTTNPPLSRQNSTNSDGEMKIDSSVKNNTMRDEITADEEEDGYRAQSESEGSKMLDGRSPPLKRRRLNPSGSPSKRRVSGGCSSKEVEG